MAIYFYKVYDPYGCFSNFSLHSIQLQNKTWLTVEHYYQAQKFVGSPDQAVILQICQAETPDAAAALGRDPRRQLRADWEQVKVQVMHQAVLTKFLSYPDIQQILLATGDEVIVENSPRDSYWGCGADGKGQNQLGKILMSVRQQIREQRLRPDI